MIFVLDFLREADIQFLKNLFGKLRKDKGFVSYCRVVFFQRKSEKWKGAIRGREFTK